MVGTALTLCAGGLLAVGVGAARASHGTMVSTREEVEVVDLVACSHNEVVAGRFVELHGGHREVEHACGAILDLRREVVEEGDVESEQRRERLVDGYGRHVEHRRRNGTSRGGVGDEAEPVEHFLVGGIRGVGSHSVDGLVGVVEVDRLEVVAEPRHLAETAVADGPVGEQSAECGEDVERLATHGGIGGEERGNHDIGTVASHLSVLGVEGLSAVGRRDRIG